MGAVFDHKAWRHAGPVYGDLAVGDITQLNVNGVAKNFIVVHQGNPDSSLYDSSCDGTWLLAKDIYETEAFDSGSNHYGNSDIHAYLNGTFLALFDAAVQSAIKQVKIPYYAAGSYYTGSSGLGAKIFLPSAAELGSNLATSASTEGAKLDYFDAGYSAKPLAEYGGAVTNYWLRSGKPSYSGYAAYVYRKNDRTYGTIADAYVTSTLSIAYGIRPCLVMPANQKIFS